MAIMPFNTGEWIKYRGDYFTNIRDWWTVLDVNGQGTSRAGFKASISIDKNTFQLLHISSEIDKLITSLQKKESHNGCPSYYNVTKYCMACVAFNSIYCVQLIRAL